MLRFPTATNQRCMFCEARISCGAWSGGNRRRASITAAEGNAEEED